MGQKEAGSRSEEPPLLLPLLLVQVFKSMLQNVRWIAAGLRRHRGWEGGVTTPLEARVQTLDPAMAIVCA